MIKFKYSYNFEMSVGKLPTPEMGTSQAIFVAILLTVL